MGGIYKSEITKAREAGDLNLTALLWRNQQISDEIDKRVRGNVSAIDGMSPTEIILGIVAPHQSVLERSLEIAEGLMTEEMDAICEHCQEWFKFRRFQRNDGTWQTATWQKYCSTSCQDKFLHAKNYVSTGPPKAWEPDRELWEEWKNSATPTRPKTTHCPSGHKRTFENTKFRRIRKKPHLKERLSAHCMICTRDSDRESKRRRRANAGR